MPGEPPAERIYVKLFLRTMAMSLAITFFCLLLGYPIAYLLSVLPLRTSNLLLILGRTDFIPIDSWALKLVSHEWYDGKPVTPREVEKHFEDWGEFKGLAFWFWDWKHEG